MRATVDASPDAIISIDVSGCIQSLNPAAEAMFGYTADELLGEKVNVLMPPPYREEHDSYVERYLRTGEARIIGIGRTVEGRRKDGEVFPIRLTVADARSDGERLFVGFVQDMSERVRDEAKIRELQTELMHASRLAALGEINSQIGHEIAQPLTAIGNYANAAQLLLGRAGDVDAARVDEMLTRVVEQSERASNVIQRLRRLSRKGDLAVSVTAVHDLIHEAGTLGLIDARQRDIVVDLDIPPFLPPVAVDRVQIQQVLLNLFRNAVDALDGADKALIRILARPGRDGFVELAVADTGTGVPEDMRPRLFNAFETSKPDGVGIGLSVCRTIVESHGGTIRHEPNPGGGAVFVFDLPVAETGDAAPR